MLYAGDVKLPTDLGPAYSGVAGTAEGRIASRYKQLGDRQTLEGAVRGMTPGSNSYGPQRFATQKGLDTGSLEAALGGQLGQAGYTNTKNIRDYNQQRQIASLIGNAMRPDIAQQIMGGLSGGANAVGQYAALFNSLGGKTPDSYSPYTSPLSLNPGFGASRYGLPSYDEEYDPYAYGPNTRSLMYRGG